eukprot:TRINITY_DN21777_c0_g1_i1.p2 TRINITY_DN21777_c0_g1~~TRINITY_DN21777_c0_g1_i1.p2  ORF type:complete len:112 (-),score=20.25 TRINITY_DN21777_c0_g1_i1:1102-1437(-)
MALSRIVGVAQLAGFALTFAGDSILPAIGFPVLPAWYLNLRQNKIGTAAGIWIMGNMAHNALLSTGAFEVSYRGKMVFSKLAEGHLPSMEELIHRVAASMEALGAEAMWPQ